MRLIGKYLVNLFVAVDQLVNAIFLGDPDETISSRLGRNFPNSELAKLVDFIFFWDDGTHTKRYIEHDEGRDSIVD